MSSIVHNQIASGQILNKDLFKGLLGKKLEKFDLWLLSFVKEKKELLFKK